MRNQAAYRPDGDSPGPTALVEVDVARADDRVVHPVNMGVVAELHFPAFLPLVKRGATPAKVTATFTVPPTPL